MNSRQDGKSALWQYRARKDQPLYSHLRECAETASLLLGQIGLSKTGKVMGWSHDFGKMSEAFAQYLDFCLKHLEEAYKKRGSVDHSTAGAQLIWGTFILRDEAQYTPVSYLMQMMSLCILSHHRHSLIDCWRGYLPGDDILIRRLEKDEEESHYEEIMGKLSPDDRKFYDELLNDSELIEEFEKLYTQFNQLKLGAFYFGFLTRFMMSVLVSADYRSASGRGALTQYPQPDWSGMQEKLEEYMKQFSTDHELNQSRSEMSAACLAAGAREQGIFSLTLPTGAGKTLASLRFALEHARTHQLARIVYVIPYTTILDQTANAIRKALGDECYHQSVIEHHSNFVMEDEGRNGEKEPWSPEKRDWYMEACQTWDVPIVLTTSVQYLNACYAAGKQHVRRMHSLARSVIIFDEVQAIPWSSEELFSNSLIFWSAIGRSTVLKCTATQPANGNRDSKDEGCRTSLDRGEVIPGHRKYFDLFSRFRNVENQCEINQNKQYWTKERMVDLIVDSAEKHQTVLVIVNTKTLAALLFKSSKEKMPEASCYHLSTNMCPKHRLGIVKNGIGKEALNQARQAKKPLICISTQLIEAGVDVDFDVVIRSVAGLDSCMQAAGRCNRDALRPGGKVIIINPAGNLEDASNLFELKTAAEVSQSMIAGMPDRSLMLAPDSVSKYFNRYKSALKSSHDSYTKKTVCVGKSDSHTNVVQLLSKNEVLLPAGKRKRHRQFSLFQAFDLASSNYKPIDDDTITVITPYGEGENLINALAGMAPTQSDEWDLWKKTLQEARPYSVSIRKNNLNNMLSSNIIYSINRNVDIYAVRPARYDNDLGYLQDSVISLIV